MRSQLVGGSILKNVWFFPRMPVFVNLCVLICSLIAFRSLVYPSVTIAGPDGLRFPGVRLSSPLLCLFCTPHYYSLNESLRGGPDHSLALPGPLLSGTAPGLSQACESLGPGISFAPRDGGLLVSRGIPVCWRRMLLCCTAGPHSDLLHGSRISWTMQFGCLWCAESLPHHLWGDLSQQVHHERSVIDIFVASR